MAPRKISLRLADMAEAIDRVETAVESLSLEDFESAWDRRWLVERGVEIVSEASRHLTDDIKTRHIAIPWTKVAAIGNVLRHSYDRVAPDVLWRLVKADLPALKVVCRKELEAALAAESPGGGDNQSS